MCIFTRIFLLPYPLSLSRDHGVWTKQKESLLLPLEFPFLSSFLPWTRQAPVLRVCVLVVFFFQNSPSLSISLSLPETAILGFSIINLVSTFILLNVGSARDRPPRPDVGSVGTALRVIESLSTEERSIDHALNWAWRHGGPWSTRQNSRCPSRLFYDFFYDFLSIISYRFGNSSRRGLMIAR